MEESFDAAALLKWFSKNARPLPWREAYKPYEVTLSEFMLQQTQVVTVLPYFDRWVKKWPSWKALAEAKEEEVLKLWEGLGYYQRARRLHGLAKYLVENGLKDMPEDREALMELPGLGPYTSAAVASIAFNKAVLPIDGNVRRVLSRYYARKEISPSKEQDAFFESQLLPVFKKIKRRRELAQALMELGASHCSPRRVDCEGCPLVKTCAMKSGDEALAYPVKKPRAKAIPLWITYAWVRKGGFFLLRQRPEKGRFPRQWEPPQVESANDEEGLSKLMILLSKNDLEPKNSQRRDFTKYKVTWNSHELLVGQDYQLDGYDFYSIREIKGMNLIPLMLREFNELYK